MGSSLSLAVALAMVGLPRIAVAGPPSPSADDLQGEERETAVAAGHQAQPRAKQASERQRYLGFGPRVGFFWGFGAGLRLGHPSFGMDLSGGYAPVALFRYDWPTDLSLDGAHSGQLNLSTYVTFTPRAKIAIGMAAGYRFNSLLGHGFSFGIDTHVNFGKHFALHLGAGPVIFPAGDDNYRSEMNVHDLAFGFPRPSFQLGTGTGLLYFP